MNRLPLVTVLMPVYNAEKFLFEALTSILTQTYTNLEILIINDGSTDRSKSIIESLNDLRIKYVENTANIGLIATLNRGLKIAAGTYIARMDADDIAHPTRIEEQVNYLETHPNIALIGSNHTILGTEKVIEYQQKNTAIISTLLFENPCAHPCLTARTDVFRSVTYNPSYTHAEDYKLIRDVSKRYSIGNLGVSLLEYRQHPDQISAAKFSQQKLTHSQIVADIFKEDFHININREIFWNFFQYKRLSLREGIVILWTYSRAFFLSLTQPRYDSKIILMRTLRLARSLGRQL